MRRAYRVMRLMLLMPLVLAGCSGPGSQAPAPERAAVTTATLPPLLLHPGARWQLAPWRELPGWEADRTREAWPALLRSCERVAPEVPVSYTHLTLPTILRV